MKILNLLLASSFVLPSLNASAQGTDGQSGSPYANNVAASAQAPIAPDILSVDSRKLYLNNTSNSGREMQNYLSIKREQLGKTHKKLEVRDRAFTDMSKDYNLLNAQTGMTFWEEWQALQNKDIKVIKDKYDEQDWKFKLGMKLKPDLILFMTWMRANGLATFKSLMANDPKGILELESLRINKAPYKIDGPTYVVTRYKDVQEALDKPELFSVRNYHQRMKDSVGDFMLGNDKKAINYEHNWARSLIDVKEMEPRIRPLVKSIFERELKALEYIKRNPYTGQLEGNIEVVNHIARRVPAILTIEYFGFEGISPEKIMEWSRATQDDFFHNIVGDQTKAATAVKAGQEMQAALVKLVDSKFKNVEALTAKPRDEQTILDRMVISIGAINSTMSVDDLLQKADGKIYLKKSDREDLEKLTSNEIVSRIKSRVRTNIIGTLVGGLETTQAAITQTLNLILGDRDLTRKAQDLAVSAKKGPQAQQKFNNLVWEVLRFHPVNPVVFRYVEKDTELSGVKLKAHSHIMIATQAAMFDPEVFPNPEAIVLNRFKSLRDDKYFHLGYGHHRCLGDYVSMIQVPEIIAGILSLENIRKMPGAFGELDFNNWINRELIGGDKADSSFPEKMILEYDSNETHPLVKKDVEIQDHKLAFEGYLNDYDRNHFRGCLSGWKIIQDDKGELLYSMDGSVKPVFYAKDPRYKTNISEFAGNDEMVKYIKEPTESKMKKGLNMAGSLIRAAQGYATNLDGEGNDLLYCRLPMKFHVCFESEASKLSKMLKKTQKESDASSDEKNILTGVKAKFGNAQFEVRNRSENGDRDIIEKHKVIFNKCATISDLTDTEKAFYENAYFDKEIKKSELSSAQAKRPAMWDKDFSHEDYFSAQDRYYTRGSYANPLGWLKMADPRVIDFYVRLNFTFRTCVGDKIKESKFQVPRCDAYKACVSGVYNKLAFKYEGALSPYERRAYNEIVVADEPCE